MTANERTLHNDLWPVAIHEAAHAVIGRVLNLSCGSVTIVPNVDEGEAGCAIIHDPWKTASEWDQKMWEEVEYSLQPSKSRHAYLGLSRDDLGEDGRARPRLRSLALARAGDGGDDRYETKAMVIARYDVLLRGVGEIRASYAASDSTAHPPSPRTRLSGWRQLRGRAGNAKPR